MAGGFLTPLRQHANTAVVQDPRALILPNRSKTDSLLFFGGGAVAACATTTVNPALNYGHAFIVTAKLRPDTWTPFGVAYGITSQFQPVGDNRAFKFLLGIGGTIRLLYYSDGTDGSEVILESSEPVPFSDGDIGWVRCELRSGDCTFRTSTDGVTYSNLGIAPPNPGSGSPATVDAPLEVGCEDGGGQQFIGEIFTVDVRVDTALRYAFDSIGYLGFSDRMISGGFEWVLTAPVFPPSRPTTGFRFDGIDSRIVTPDRGDFSGDEKDLDVIAHIQPDDWSPATRNVIAAKYSNITGISWLFSLEIGGALHVETHESLIRQADSVPVPSPDGSALWVRCAIDWQANECTFYTSPDGKNWAVLTGPIPPVSGDWRGYDHQPTPVEIGVADDAQLWPFDGVIRRFIWKAAIDGDVISDMQPSEYDVQRWAGGPLDEWSRALAAPVKLDGISGHVTRPNAGVADAALKPQTALDIRAHLTLTDWANGAKQVIYGSWLPTQNLEVEFSLTNLGALQILLSDDGTGSTGGAFVGLGLADGATKWVRVTWSAGDVARFFLSDDGINWTANGTIPITLTGDLIGTAEGSPFTFGGTPQDITNLMAGRIFYGDVRGIIDGPRLLTLEPPSLVSDANGVWTLEPGAVIAPEFEVWTLEKPYPIGGPQQ